MRALGDDSIDTVAWDKLGIQDKDKVEGSSRGAGSAAMDAVAPLTGEMVVVQAFN